MITDDNKQQAVSQLPRDRQTVNYSSVARRDEKSVNGAENIEMEKVDIILLRLEIIFWLLFFVYLGLTFNFIFMSYNFMR